MKNYYSVVEDDGVSDLNLEKNEKRLIVKALNKFNTYKEAAAALEISERILYKKVKEYSIMKN